METPHSVPHLNEKSALVVSDSVFLQKIAEGPYHDDDPAITFPPEHSLITGDGTYTFTVAFDEWNGTSFGTTCTVILEADSVQVLHDGTSGLTGKEGDVLEAGTLMKHKRTGKWIIGHGPNDVNAEEIGGCGEGPTIIDLKQKIFWTC